MSREGAITRLTDINDLIAGLFVSANKIYVYSPTHIYRVVIGSGTVKLQPLLLKKKKKRVLMLGNRTKPTYIYSGVGDGKGGAFFLTSEGLYYFDKEDTLAVHLDDFHCTGGSSVVYYPVSSSGTSSGLLFFACGHKLLEKKVYGNSVAVVHTMRSPIVDSRVKMVYDERSSLLIVPGYDGHVYAYGLPRYKSAPVPIAWIFTTDGPISTTPLLFDGKVYVSSGQYIYAISESSGKLVWKRKIYGESQAPVVLETQFNDRPVVLVSSLSGNIFLFDADTGAPVFSFNVGGGVAGFVVHDGVIYYTLISGYAGAYDITDYGCAVSTSIKDLKIGYKVVNLTGTYFTSAASPSVEICIVPYGSHCQDSDWVAVSSINNGHWSYLMNPMHYPFGALDVRCRIEDSEHSVPANSTPVMVVRNKNLPKNRLSLHYPLFVQAGSTVRISVTDERGGDVGQSYVFLNGKKYKTSKEGTLKLKITQLFGIIHLTAEKQWYSGDRGVIIVYPPLTYLCVGALLVLLVFVGVVVYVMRRRMQSLM